MLSLVIGSGALGRAISPFWCELIVVQLCIRMCGCVDLLCLSACTCNFAVVESYDLSRNHTYISMAVTSLCLALILISLVALYRNLAPNRIQTEGDLITRHASVNFLASLDVRDSPPGIYL